MPSSQELIIQEQDKLLNHYKIYTVESSVHQKQTPIGESHQPNTISDSHFKKCLEKYIFQLQQFNVETCQNISTWKDYQEEEPYSQLITGNQ